MRSLASPFRVKWFAALAGGGVSQTEEKVVFKEAHDRALVSSWGAALGPLFMAPHRSLNESQRESPLRWHQGGIQVRVKSFATPHLARGIWRHGSR